MAKNYTFAEAVKIINAGTDLESIADIGRRYPVLLAKTANVCALAGQAFVDLMSFMPDYLTANKVNTALKAAVGGNTEAETEAEDTDEVAEETAETKSEAGAQDYESMSAKEMWDLLGKAGKRKLAKSTKKADLVEACKKAFGGDAEEAEADEAEETEVETETEAGPYDGKSAMELFKECKKRGIKAAPKKPAKFYADLLTKADAEAKTGDTESDDWDEDEEPAEEPKATKKSKKDEEPKAEKKPAKKAAKKEEPADEDDDWDI